jgi:hypothetical protein
MWDDRRLDDPTLRGRDAVYVGYMNDDLRAAFERVETLQPIKVIRHGLLVRSTPIHRCLKLRGMTRPEGMVRH